MFDGSLGSGSIVGEEVRRKFYSIILVKCIKYWMTCDMFSSADVAL